MLHKKQFTTDSSLEPNGAVRFVLLILLVALPLCTILVINFFAGPQWDLVAHSLNGRTLLSFITNSGIGARAAFAGEFAGNLAYYFEPYRAPLSTPIFALLWIFFGRPVLPYMIIVYAASVLALYLVGRELRIDVLVLFSVFLNPYAIYFFFVPNGMEGLSVVLVLIGIVYLLKRSSMSGLFLGLASLAKYPSLVLLPLVFLLGRKKAPKAAFLEFAVVLPWLLFNYLVYGNPVYSYLAAVTNIVTGIAYTAVHPVAVLTVVAYPVAFAAAALLIWARHSRSMSMPSLPHSARVLLALIVLSAVGYVFVLPHNDPFTQVRFGYLFSTSLMVSAALLFSRITTRRTEFRHYAAAAAVVALAIALTFTYFSYNNAAVLQYNVNHQGNVYQQAEAELTALGFGSNCRIMSNAWVPFLYQRYDAYSPFTRYTSNTITPIVEGLAAQEGINYSSYVTGQSTYPIVVIENAGVAPSLIMGLDNASLTYNSTYIRVYLPSNATCYRG